jgi:predicted DNA-binding transcriptional regulator AlpA
MDDRCVGWKVLQLIVPYSRQHVARLETDPKYMGDDPFPRRVQLSQCRVCWWLSEVMAWLKRRSDRRTTQ